MTTLFSLTARAFAAAVSYREEERNHPKTVAHLADLSVSAGGHPIAHHPGGHGTGGGDQPNLLVSLQGLTQTYH